MQNLFKRGLLVGMMGLGIGVVILSAALSLIAQDEIIITLGVQEWQRELFTPDLFADFYAAHPGVKVVVVSLSDDGFFPPPAYGAEDHFKGVESLVATADVLQISSYTLSAEGTQTGAFLDLAPLVTTDTDLNVDDFYPAVWQSFQWDRGIWAFPLVASVNMVVYKAAAFDEIGYPHPSETWTTTDFFQAARALTQYDTNGDVTIPGFMAWNTGNIYTALTGSTTVDDTTFPGSPRINTPELAAFFEEWMALQEEGVINNPGNNDFDMDQVPMRIDRLWQLYNANSDSADWQAALLPGGKALLDVEGLAVSAGTEQPELAYALAKYLSTQPQMVNILFGDSPARRSLAGMAPDDSSFYFRPQLSEDVQALINRALENGIPVSTMRFSEYVNAAYGKMSNPDSSVSIQTALQEVETEALANQASAADRQAAQTVMVMTPIPTPVLSQGEIALRFRVQGMMSPSPNQDEWERAISEFTANDPQVGYVELLTGFNPDPEADLVDCFYEDWDGRIANMDMTNPDILSLDPFLDADPLFDRADVFPRVLEQVEREGRIWGYPLVIYPEVMWYNYDLFTQANAIMPEDGWTAADFNDAIQTLSTLPDIQPVFVPMDFSGTYMLMLMAAYGALPYDYRTDPPTINVTDPTAVEAMRQVLDLARDGSIKYQALADMGGGGGGMLESPIYTDTLNTMSWIFNSRSNPDEGDPNAANYRMTTYPAGTEFSPISYMVGNAYIDAETPYADACYRWISYIAQQPGLFTGMPVRQSRLDDPALAAAHGEDILNVYRQIADLLGSPQALIFGNNSTTYRGGWMEQRWLYRVFDNYVLEDGDLETDLNQFAEDVVAYRECLVDVPDFSTLGEDASQAEMEALFNQFADCAIAVDPSTAEMFGR